MPAIIEAPNATTPRCPKNAVSVNVMSVCAKFPIIIGTAMRQISFVDIVFSIIRCKNTKYYDTDCVKNIIFVIGKIMSLKWALFL